MKYMPWIPGVIAVWLIAAPFVLGYDNTEAAKNNDVGVGVVMLLGSLIWGFSEMRDHELKTDMQAQHR